jgi:GNAT superfamily N-acetyltransferase
MLALKGLTVTADFLFVERAMTEAEYTQEIEGFNVHGQEHGNPTETAERFGFVVLRDSVFIAASSGLAYKSEKGYGNWFYLSDLYVDKAYRGQGLGGKVLGKLERKVALLSMSHIWTWTAGYDGYGFYLKQGYDIFAEFENWYHSGHSRFGMRKAL